MSGGIEGKKIIVLMGGDSPEAAVSRSSAKGVVAALEGLGFDHEAWELDSGVVAKLAGLARDKVIVFCNALHGGAGENGTVQGALELLGLRHTGSGVLASALAMDKLRACRVLAGAGVTVAAGGEVKDTGEIGDWLARCGRVVVKPVDGGSSLGVTILERADGAEAAFGAARGAGGGRVMVEDFIPGVELTVGVLAGEGETVVLPVIEIVPAGGEYDYDSKYSVGGSDHIIPARLPAEVTVAVQQAARAAGEAVGAKGAYRVDVRHDPATGRVVVLEVNTLPGLTPTSLLPDAARVAGMDYPFLVRWMLENC